jgi:hypothetical protein
MAEDRQILTRTQVNTTENEIDIHIYYIGQVDKLISFFISDTQKNVEGISFNQGDLGYTFQNTSDLFVKNNVGNLLVTSTESEKYSIDDSGQLIYEE